VRYEQEGPVLVPPLDMLDPTERRTWAVQCCTQLGPTLDRDRYGAIEVEGMGEVGQL
jgi:hypothetical protein